MRRAAITGIVLLIAAALDHVNSGDRGRKVPVVVSDGGDNKSHVGQGQLLKKAADSSAVIYTLGIFDADDPDRNPDVLRRIAHSTGGEAFFPGKIDEVVATCKRIASDIRHRYTIGYVSRRGAGRGEFRAVRVVASSAGKHLVTRTRSGFAGNAGAR